MALWFRQTKDALSGVSIQSTEIIELKESLMRLPISFGMAIQTRDKCKEVAERLKSKEHCFVLGKGKNYQYFYSWAPNN